MPTLSFDSSLAAHVAGALNDYVAKLREHQQATPSKAEKAEYEKTVAEIRTLLDNLYRQS